MFSMRESIRPRRSARAQSLICVSLRCSFAERKGSCGVWRKLTISQQDDDGDGHAGENRTGEVQQARETSQSCLAITATSASASAPPAPAPSVSTAAGEHVASLPVAPARPAARLDRHLADVEDDGLSLPRDAQQVADDGLVDDAVGSGLAVAADLDGRELWVAFLAGELVCRLLVVQAWHEEERVQPGGASLEGGALGEGAQVCESEEACGREAEVGYWVARPAWDEGIGEGSGGACGRGHLVFEEQF